MHVIVAGVIWCYFDDVEILSCVKCDTEIPA